VNILQKTITKIWAKRVSKHIDKANFLDNLYYIWRGEICQYTDIDYEVQRALERINKSGLKDVFDAVGVTEGDIKAVLERIIREKQA